MAQYETSVGSFTTSLFETTEGSGPNTVATIAFEGKYPQVPKLLEAAFNGLAVKLPAAYKYAQNTYTYGLPEGFKQLPVSDTTDLRNVLQSIAGYPVDIVTVLAGPADPEYFADRYATYGWGLQYAEQFLTVPPIAKEDINTPVVIKDAIFKSGTALAITLKYGPSTAYEKTITVNSPLITHNPNKKYYQVRYRPTGATTTAVDYFVYEIGSQVYPSLDDDFTQLVSSPFLPIIPLRQDGINLGPEINEDGEFVIDGNGNRVKPDTDLYRTSVRLCKLLDVNFDDITKMLHTGEVEDIDHAYLHFGIDIRTKTKAGKKYLYQFFDLMSTTFGRGINTLEMSDAYYRMQLSWSDIIRTVHAGQVNKQGELSYSGDNFTVKYNLTPTSYVEIRVEDLEHRNFVYKDHSDDRTLSDTADSEKGTFYIPINYNILTTNNALFERNDLLREGFVITVNSYDRTKLKWYQTDLFKTIMLLAALAASVYTLGSSLAYIGTAYAAGGIWGAIQAAGWLALQVLVVKVGVQWLSSFIPPEVLVLIQITLVVMALGGGLGGDSAFWDAENMLSLSQAVNEGIQMGIEDAMQQIQDDMDELLDTIKTQTEELDAMQSELDVSTDWFKEVIAEKIDIPVIESPEQFYTRTIHAGNIGTASLNVIENYVDNALKLPELRKY